MESQAKYDFAIFGENLASWIAALLLARQGERVLILPEVPERAEFDGRILFGLEPEGLLLRLLERWGLPKGLSANFNKARMECLTPDASLWLQGSLDAEALGVPAFELKGPSYRKLLQVIETLERDGDWRAGFEKEFLRWVAISTRKKFRWLPFLPNAQKSWNRAIRRALQPRVRGARMPREAVAGNGAGRLIRGIGRLLSSDANWKRNSPELIQFVSGFFALRNSYFSDEVFSSMRGEFRKLLRSCGVEFLSEGLEPRFKRDPSGAWEATYDSEGKSHSIQFDQLIFARQLTPEALDRFEKSARESIEADLEKTSYDRYEMEILFKGNPFPFSEPAELASHSTSGGWVRLSVYQKPDPKVRVGAWVPVDAVQTKGDARVVTERRLLREIRDSLPGLAIDSELSRVNLEVFRERRFKAGIGVKGGGARIWHAHHQSHPKIAEYGPIVAAIEIARRRARRKGRELSI